MASLSNPEFLERLKVLTNLAGGASALAKIASVSLSAVRKYLQGSEPTRPVLAAIAQGLGVRSGWLVDGCGAMCEPDSPVVRRARYQIGNELSKCLALPEYREEGMVGGARMFAAEYQEGNERFPVANWVRLAVPKLTFDEAKAWQSGQLDYVAADEKDTTSIQASPMTVARVAASIRRKYGEDIADLPAKKEAYLFAASCDQYEKFGKDGMPEAVLDNYIGFLSFEYDKSGLAE